MKDPFSQHPQCWAQRLRERVVESTLAELTKLGVETSASAAEEGCLWLDITLDSTPQEIDRAIRQFTPDQDESARGGDLEDVEPTGTITACPMPPDWRTWDMLGTHRFDHVPPDVAAVVAAAKRARPVEHLAVLQPVFEVAADDGSLVPMTPEESGQPEWKFKRGNPRHRHAEFVHSGSLVHVDHLSATKFGPGRSYVEIRIFIDGRLAGRGGRCGISLGGGGADYPAVALFPNGTAVTVSEIDHAPVIELWALEQESR